MSTAPFAYIAHKDGKWAGVIAGNSPPHGLREFLGDFAGEGFAIMTVASRDEYNAALASMEMWRPEKSRAAAEPDLFGATTSGQGTE
jgi:hypothetical protein